MQAGREVFYDTEKEIIAEGAEWLSKDHSYFGPFQPEKLQWCAGCECSWLAAGAGDI